MHVGIEKSDKLEYKKLPYKLCDSVQAKGSGKNKMILRSCATKIIWLATIPGYFNFGLFALNTAEYIYYYIITTTPIINYFQQ